MNKYTLLFSFGVLAENSSVSPSIDDRQGMGQAVNLSMSGSPAGACVFAGDMVGWGKKRREDRDDGRAYRAGGAGSGDGTY